MCFFLMQVMQVFVFKQTKNNKRFHETLGRGFSKEFFPEFGEMIQTFDPQLLTFSKTGQQKTSTNQLEQRRERAYELAKSMSDEDGNGISRRESHVSRCVGSSETAVTFPETKESRGGLMQFFLGNPYGM